MARETVTMTIDCPDRQRLADLFARFAELHGEYTFTGKPTRQSASQKQHGYYRSHVVPVFARFVESTGQPIPKDRAGIPLFDTYEDYAHAILKERNLRIRVPDLTGGEIAVVCSTGQLSREQMGDYIERARKYMWDEFELMTMDPDPNWRMSREREAVVVSERYEPDDFDVPDNPNW